MIVRRLIPILLLFFPIYSQVYYLEIYNPNSYDLIDYQLKINVSQYNIPIPIAKIETLDGTNVPFCYEQPNGECNSTYTNTTEIIWIKLPYVKARWYTHIKIIVNGTNGAVHGDKVFDFYDDFNYQNIPYEIRSNYGQVYLQNGKIYFQAEDPDNAVNNNIGYAYIKIPFQIRPGIIIELLVEDIKDVDWDVKVHLFDDTFLKTVGIGLHGYKTPKPIIGFSYYIQDTQDTVAIADLGTYQSVKWYSSSHIQENTPVIIGLAIKSNNVFIGYAHFLNNTYILQPLTETTDTFTSFSPYIYLGNLRTNIDGNYDGEPAIADADWFRIRKYADRDPIVRSVYLSSLQLLQYTLTSYRYQFTYLYVIPIRITSNSPIGITNLVIPIRLDTKSLISQGILKSDCSDISVTIYDPSTDTEINAKQYIDLATCNTDNTIIYVNIPEYFVGRDIFLNIYIGSPSAVPIQDPETFYWFVDLSNPSDYNKIQIFTNGTVSYNITTEGLVINIGSDGKLVIYNR